MEIDNKVTVITGASSCIGRAVAIELSKHSNKLILVARREKLLMEVKAEAEQNGSECIAMSGDALDEKFCEDVVGRAVELYGRIDIAVLNIGIGLPSNTLTTSAQRIKHCMRVNFDTFINFYVPIMQQMKTQTEECMITHVNSLASFFGIPMQGDYTAAKGAVRLFLQTARMELKHFGIKHIKLQTIHPGFVRTDAVKDDGIPAPNEISEEKAAEYIVNGIIKNKKENMFPFGTALPVRLARRFFPEYIITKAVLSETPSEY